jgi:hypothetical protein
MSDAGGRFRVEELRVEVSKNSSTAASSNDGEFDTSTTTAAPKKASARPSPVSVFHARVRGGRRRFVAAVAELGDDLRADEPAATYHDEFHDAPFVVGGLWRQAVTDRRRSRGSRRIASGWAGSPVVQRDAVLSVQLGGVRPTGERAVRPFLEPPVGELAVAVEHRAGDPHGRKGRGRPEIGRRPRRGRRPSGEVSVVLGGHGGDLEQGRAGTEVMSSTALA